MPLISIRTSGPFEIGLDGGTAPQGLRWRKHAALLLYLALSPRATRARSHLLGLLWGDKDEAAARHSLNEAIRVIRRAAGDRTLRTDADNVILDLASIDCDALRFDAAMKAERWEEAAELVAGEFAEGLDVDAEPFEEWIAAERGRRRTQAVEALAHATRCLLDAGRTGEALRVAERAVAMDPCSELGARALMRARALAGDSTAALGVYASLAASLEAAFGTGPGPETRALLERVRLQPVPVVSRRAAEPRRTPLAGRAVELELLLRALQRTSREGRPGFFVIEADAGMGKSRLAEEVVLRARLDGAIACVARAIETDVAEPYSGLDALACAGLLDAAGIGGAHPSAVAAFARRLPSWGDRFPALRSAEPEPSLARAFEGIVRAAAEAQPLLFVVDDAQWLDGASFLALLGLLRSGGGPVALLTTLDPRIPRDEADTARARIGRDVDGSAVRLGPLDGGAVASLAAGMLRATSEEQLARLTRRLLADTGGLPLLLVEVLSAIQVGLELDHDAPWPPPARTFDATRPGELPDPVVAAIRVGFRRLGEDARSVLCALAVLGGRVAPGDAAVAAGLDPDRALRALDELEWARWVVSEPRGYGCTAAVAAEVIARDMMTAGQRRRILERAGRLTPA